MRKAVVLVYLGSFTQSTKNSGVLTAVDLLALSDIEHPDIQPICEREYLFRAGPIKSKLMAVTDYLSAIPSGAIANITVYTDDDAMAFDWSKGVVIKAKENGWCHENTQYPHARQWDDFIAEIHRLKIRVRMLSGDCMCKEKRIRAKSRLLKRKAEGAAEWKKTNS